MKNDTTPATFWLDIDQSFISYEADNDADENGPPGPGALQFATQFPDLDNTAVVCQTTSDDYRAKITHQGSLLHEIPTARVIH